MKLFKFICAWFLLFSLISGYMVISSPSVCAETENGFTYYIFSDHAYITHYTGSPDVFIPSTLGGWPVVEIETFGTTVQINSLTFNENCERIADGVFQNMHNITSIKLPHSLTRIGIGSFNGAMSYECIENMTLSGNLAYIGTSAFSSNRYVHNWTIGPNVTYIGDYAFSGLTEAPNLNFTFLGLTIPTLGGSHVWNLQSNNTRGHALNNSNFPAPGNYFGDAPGWIMMGNNYLAPNVPTVIIPDEKNINDFSLMNFVKLLITFIIILLPAALVGTFVGRFGFIIMLSLMMAIYMIIEPMVLPTALVVWTQAAIMFYRGG